MQNKENTLFLAVLRLSFALIGLKNALKHSLKRLFGGGGANGLPTKMQNKENTTFLAVLRLSFALIGLKNALKHSLKRLFGEGG